MGIGVPLAKKPTLAEPIIPAPHSIAPIRAERRQEFAEFLAPKLLEGSDVERLFRLHALAV
jgi:hypothetical protein